MAVYFIEHTRNKLTGKTRQVHKWFDPTANIDEVVDEIANQATYGGTKFVPQSSSVRWYKHPLRPILDSITDYEPAMIAGVQYPYVTIGQRNQNTVQFNVYLAHPSGNPNHHVEHHITFFETLELA